MQNTFTIAPEHSVETRPVPDKERLLFISAGIFILCWLIFYLVMGARQAFWFDGAPGDGPFQVFNPLRRIAAGQVGGRDFVFYHGIGIPYLHYPLFALFGAQTISASELSRQWTSSLCFALSLFAFVRAALGRTKWIWVAMAIVLMSIEAIFPMAASPALSQVALRATMPLFAFAALLLPLSDFSKSVVTGIFLGLALPFGTEHGIALAVAFSVTSAAVFVKQIAGGGSVEGALRREVVFSLTVIVTAVVTAGVTWCLLSGPKGAMQALRYALVDLPADKFWYDGTPPNPYLGQWSDLLHSRHIILQFLPACAALGLLLAMVPRFWSNPARLSRNWEPLVMLMLIYGILSCVPLLGYVSKHYVVPIVRVLALTGLLLVAKLGRPIFEKIVRANRAERVRQISRAAFCALCLAASGVLIASSTVTAVRFINHRQSESFSYSKELNQAWNTFMTEATKLLDERGGGTHPSLWSTYSGLLESHYGIFTPAEDYMTLSVGSRWPGYLDKFRSLRPQFVQTMAPSYSAYEEWLQNVKWDFYEDLLDNYNPIRQIGHAILWTRKPGPWAAPSDTFKPVAMEGQMATLSSTDDVEELVVIRVRYSIQNPWKRLPFLGLTPRYFAVLEGTPRNNPVSFPPYATEFRFAVSIPPHSTIRMRFVTRTLLPGAAFHVEGVELKNLPYEPSQEIVTRARH